ncbi:Wadjet anti-phage system protein JetD domain-containing protein [Natranaerofaba carboxydovora]|uniref:Wadjet anti-phage system protein JetD domain-containing protein n=1 Tax=Natranaerofaba carboxydovora TaxID=2742683 RepID=UPI001F1379AD|nr:Wadjet anti-phage system protein JetD domain-containing protein [Natranaerofaba carboxydovora]UMZ74966.1 hypothetical protein ACONDI_02572 [Natranaerofaba carboxydovora]
MKHQNHQDNQNRHNNLNHQGHLSCGKESKDLPANLPVLSKLQKKELTKLIDKYENRKDYGQRQNQEQGQENQDQNQEQKTPRKTYVHIKEKNYPNYYHISDSSFRLEYNADMEELERMGLIQLVWKKFEKGEFLEKIALEEKRLENIYRLLNRQPKSDYYNELEKVYNKYREAAPKALMVFYDKMLEKIKRLENLPHRVRFDSLRDTEDFLLGLNNIVENGLRSDPVEIPKRQFSIELYGESKRLENFEKKILYVLQNYIQVYNQAYNQGYNQNYNISNEQDCSPNYRQEYNLETKSLETLEENNSHIKYANIEDIHTEDEISLAEFGIIDNPRPINIRGQLEFETDKGMVDLNKFYPDVGLSPKMIQDMKITGINAKAVVTIENLTSYYIYIKNAPKDHLVIYLGGYHNKMRRSILTKIWQFQKSCQDSYQGSITQFYHWGDIDYGGFRIFNHLKAKTGIPFKPLMMDEKTYETHLDKGHKFESNYERKLEKLLNNEDYIEFHPVIRLMLDKKIRLEQEGITEIIYS